MSVNTGTPLFNPNDNVTGRDGGPYLDEVEATEAEERRAEVEGRSPVDPAPAPAGMPLLSGSRIAPVIGVNNLPSQASNFSLNTGELVEARAADEDVPFEARGEIPGDFEPSGSTDGGRGTYDLDDDEATDEGAKSSDGFSFGSNQDQE